MSGREIEKNLHKRRYGLYTRLQAHASGRLSGDQFCVYVANRLVIPELKQEQLEQFRDGHVNLDMLTKEYVQSWCNFVLWIVARKRLAWKMLVSGASIMEKCRY